MKIKKALIIALSVIFLICVAMGVYVGDYYRADKKAISAMASTESIDNITVFGSRDAEVGLIFYPGGKVEYSAYAPLLERLSDNGVFCVLVKMPLNLAVFDVNAADGICEQFPDVKSWYIGGHSLGGSMAAAYISENVDDFEGLILLASYSTVDLSDTDLSILSVYGTEDKVLDLDKYCQNSSNLPPNLTESIIEGGCHAYFGTYGLQDGDGTPEISQDDQIDLTVTAVLDFINTDQRT